MAGEATTRAGSSGTATRGRAEAGLSIVVPLFNEADNLPALHGRIIEVGRTLKAARGLATEVVYVDDGSRDATLAVARELPADGVDIQVVSLSRNFGKEAGLLAGLDHARLGAVLFMDGDGQHPPALVERLVSYWLDDGYDVVYTAKAHRENEPWLRRLGVKTFYQLINWGAPPPRCGNSPSATASSRGSRAGSAFDKSASTTSRRSASTAAPPGTCLR
jgi:glycosyltransferase involved in cell wall biosynthesis